MSILIWLSFSSLVDGAEFGHNAFFISFERGKSLFFEELIVSGVVDNVGYVFDAVFFEVGFNTGEAAGFDFFEFAHCVLLLYMV